MYTCTIKNNYLLCCDSCPDAWSLLNIVTISHYCIIGNIGLSREFDQRWITQFNSLFCVTNEMGQVMTWKLTNGVAFSNIEDVLTGLKNRIMNQGKQDTEFYVDICCTWRQKIQSVFGPTVCVYLDLFHAVKRISSTISKKNPLFYQCVAALKLVFRDPTDKGETRQKPTPSPDIINKNLDTFLEQWRNRTANSKPVINNSTEHEVSNLRKHIGKGCLSGIKPGRGTNRNEALHKSLNMHIKCSKYGVELANMIFTTFFYQHNESISSKQGKRYPKLIMEFEEELKEKKHLV